MSIDLRAKETSGGTWIRRFGPHEQAFHDGEQAIRTEIREALRL